MYNAGSIVAYIQLNKREWDRPIRSIRGDIANLTRLSDNLGRKFLALGTAIMGMGIIGVREFGKFERAMRVATSVSDMTEKEFRAASESAIEVSKRWNVAATTVANAYLFLGRAGLKAAEQMAAVEHVTVASKAMLTDLEQTTEGVINIIRAFGYEFSMTGEIVGQITYAANKSTQSLSDLLIAMSYAAKPAQAANTSFQQLAASLMIAANQGIRGSKAGTALRFTFTNLMEPTRKVIRLMQKWGIEVYTAEGYMKSFPDIIEQLENALKGATEEQRNYVLASIAGKRALPTLLALFGQGSDKIRELTGELANAGEEAENVAKKQLKAFLEKLGLIGKQLKSIVYTIVDQFMPNLKAVADKLLEMTQNTEDWIKANKDQVKEMVKSIANLGLLALKVGAVLILLPKLINFSAAVISAVTNPIILSVAAIYGLTVAFRGGLNQMLEDLKVYVANAIHWVAILAIKINDLMRPFAKRLGIDIADTRIEDLPEPPSMEPIFDRYIETFKLDIERMMSAISTAFRGVAPDSIQSIVGKLKAIFDELSSALNNAGNAADETGEKLEKAVSKALPDKPKFDKEWLTFTITWRKAVEDVNDSLLTVKQTCEEVIMGMNDAFRSGLREWIGGGWSLVGAFKDIFSRIKSLFLDLIATITVNSIQKALLKSAGGDVLTLGLIRDIWQSGGGFSGAMGRIFPAPTTGPGTGYPSGYSPLSKAVPGDFSGNRMAKPAITFNITNEIPGAELAIISAETQADRTVLNASMRLASSNSMYRRTFVNPGGR